MNDEDTTARLKETLHLPADTAEAVEADTAVDGMRKPASDAVELERIRHAETGEALG